MLMINTYYHVCRTCHKPAWIFTCTKQVFACWNGLTGFFPPWGFIFPHASLNRLFFFMEVLYFCNPSWSSNCGDEWHRPRILWDWNRWLGLGIEPWTHNKIMLQRQGFKPWTYQKDYDARPGVWTLDLPKRLCAQSLTWAKDALWDL